MTKPTYFAPRGGNPAQTELLTGRAVFTEAYAVIPKGVMMDIVTSFLPFWDQTRLWVIARPLSGFAETFSQYIMEVAPGGGSDQPEIDRRTMAADVAGGRERRRHQAVEAEPDEGNGDAGAHDEGQAGVPAAVGDRRDVEEILDLLGIGHLRQGQPEAEDDAAREGSGEHADRGLHVRTCLTT